MNRTWHIILSAVSTIALWVYSERLDLDLIPLVLIVLTPIVSLAGLTFPDLDHNSHLLRHRSFLTHSALIGVLLLIRFFQANSASILLNIFCFNVGIHLLADLKMPSKMVGYATVKLPDGKNTKAKTIKSMPKSHVSIIWLLLNGVLLIILSIMTLPDTL